MSQIAQLILPAIRWDADRGGFAHARPAMERSLSLGVGGFILFGGTQDGVRALTKELRLRSRVPLLIAADLERGAGQQFTGATGLPPLAAIASLNDSDAVRRAARLTAREARTMGVNWAYAPVCDLDVERNNPIVGTRSLGADPNRVSALAAEWIDACQAEGVLACAKHFPGHGRTLADSHDQTPVVNASKKELLETDLRPFRAAAEAGVASMMTAHVSYPSLDSSGSPATLSREILQWLLRQQLKFDGLIVSDALIMEGLTGAAGSGNGVVAADRARREAEAAVQALQAGCDLLLYPSDPDHMARALEQAVRDGALDSERIYQSVRRRLKWAQWASPPNEYRKPAATDIAWAWQLADRCVHQLRGELIRLTSPLDAIVIDDDIGGPHPPPSREPFFDTLRTAGWDVRHTHTPPTDGRRSLVIALFGDIRGWKGRPGYSDETRKAIDTLCSAARDSVVIQFSHPRLASEITGARNVIVAWGGEAAMQHAAARWVVGSARESGVGSRESGVRSS
ncbi:MAG: glycoside hydrolase family 3 protein [Gemmatimonadaceae bacterium]